MFETHLHKCKHAIVACTALSNSTRTYTVCHACWSAYMHARPHKRKLQQLHALEHLPNAVVCAMLTDALSNGHQCIDCLHSRALSVVDDASAPVHDSACGCARAQAQRNNCKQSSTGRTLYCMHCYTIMYVRTPCHAMHIASSGCNACLIPASHCRKCMYESSSTAL